MKINYDKKLFRTVSNSDNAETTEDTIFHYKQEGNILTATYSGKKIQVGFLLGLVNDNGMIDMRYQQVNCKGELMTGVCHSKPEVLKDGRIRIYENWEWTSGDKSKGQSVLEEVPV